MRNPDYSDTHDNHLSTNCVGEVERDISAILNDIHEIRKNMEAEDDVPDLHQQEFQNINFEIEDFNFEIHYLNNNEPLKYLNINLG